MDTARTLGRRRHGASVAQRHAEGVWLDASVRPAHGGLRGRRQAINFYEINNNFYAVQMNNPFQTVDVRNRAPSPSIGADADQGTRTVGRLN
ncbi:hypothetical protein GCM10027081_13070 [Cupriavidus yeoncheonensis]